MYVYVICTWLLVTYILHRYTSFLKHHIHIHKKIFIVLVSILDFSPIVFIFMAFSSLSMEDYLCD